MAQSANRLRTIGKLCDVAMRSKESRSNGKPLSKRCILHSDPCASVDWRRFRAVLFDLDGVVTNSARLHALAWKELFDEILRIHASATGVEFRPFDIQRDYARYVDGRPREDGIRAFLVSRGFEIGEDEAEGAPGLPSIKDIAARKNEKFLKLLEKFGIGACPGALRVIHELRALGCRLAIISSSQNCSSVLRSARLLGKFDVQIDANVAQRMQLAGKPAPDTFLEAAHQLQVAPREAVVLEDSISGVQAAQAGHFGFVVGVDRLNIGPDLLANGADCVVTELAQLLPASNHESKQDVLHSTAEITREVEAQLKNKRVALFLDYDGTLTPIVERPDLAILDDGIREIVRRLAAFCPVTIISGRMLPDIAKRVGIDTVIYAGSHGFEIDGPEAHPIRNTVGADYVPAVRSAVKALHKRLNGIDGVIIEDKTFSVAVHYRLVDETRLAEVKTAIDGVLAAEPRLSKIKGKKVYELRPNIEWDKGRALLWILRELNLDCPDVVPIFIGDDVTDEDAFELLGKRGISLKVGGSQPTRARYRVADPEGVRNFLQHLAEVLDEAAN